MKVLITASTGELGRKIIDSLISLGFPKFRIIAGARNVEKAKEIYDDIEVRHCDFDDKNSLLSAFDLCSLVHIIPTLDLPEKRIVQMNDTIDAAKEKSVHRITWSGLVASEKTSKFSIAPYFVYSECKLMQSGLDYTILRNGMYFDPVFDWIPDIIKMKRLKYPVSRGKIAYISREDIAYATAKVISEDGHENKEYNLTSPRAYSMEELAALIGGFTGTDVSFKKISDDEYRLLCYNDGLPEPITEILLTMYKAVDNNEFLASSDFETITGRQALSPNKYLKKYYKAQV
ncbi:SDR family oxidoreductase [Candidatus Kapabacteria bacterium]|nr:SDR family oxidoreductase [Candidatus Kapabacteria bacterium]